MEFSYYEERATWLQDSEGTALVLRASRGVTVEKLDPLAYRVSYGKRASSLRWKSAMAQTRSRSPCSITPVDVRAAEGRRHA